MKSDIKIISWNINGIRAVYKKGFERFFEKENADIVCLQETKAKTEQLSENIIHPLKYHSVFNSAKRPGYSGVAMFSKKEPQNVTTLINDTSIDDEGRIIIADYKNFTLISTYFPNSQPERKRIDYKLHFCKKFHKLCESLRGKGKNLIICGDYNIAHTEIDLANPKTNEDSPGFLPEEREWMTKFLASGYVDGFRHFIKEPEHYTWWSYRTNARARNIGWRIDYFTCNEEHISRFRKIEHLNSVMGSDHCPIKLTLKS